MKSKIGRPRALTPEVQREILRRLAMGNYMTSACLAAGIDRDTVYLWQRRHDEGDPEAEIYAEFFGNLARVSAVAECDAVSTVIRGGMGWQGSAWWLGKRYPKRWSEKARATAAQPTLDPATPMDEDGNAVEP